jgi:hypothetical protein
MNYRFAYAVGFHPWEDAEGDPPFAEKISKMFDREENGREPPYGPALDLGTGSGIWGVQLATRGWQVTGVDIVEKALRRARDRVENAGVDVRLVHGDVTALREAGVGSDFQLVLDTGTFHGLNSAQREAMGREVSAVATPDATVLLLVWPKRRRPPDTGGEPQRGRGGLPRMEGDRRGGVALPPAQDPRAAAEARRAVVPAPSRVSRAGSPHSAEPSNRSLYPRAEVRRCRYMAEPRHTPPASSTPSAAGRAAR